MQVLKHATERQREINRMMCPNIKEKMVAGYAAGRDATGGPGRFSRMKQAVMAHVNSQFVEMFEQVRSSLRVCSYTRAVTDAADAPRLVRRSVSRPRKAFWLRCTS